MKHEKELATAVLDFVRKDFTPAFGQPRDWPASNPCWSRLRELGTSLWLDTGSLEESGALWNPEFQALTTNNTLLNQEVQRGIYDKLVGAAVALLSDFGLDRKEMLLELAFILNAYHGLRLVEKYDAYVSVEEHTDLAHDIAGAVRYALRYYEVCPQRFIVKIPFTPSGLITTRLLSDKGIPVNHTLGFAARQNYVIARIGRPQYVNVFMGRLNSLVSSNGLGDGSYVGEKATLASQALVTELRDAGHTPSRQIGASLRSGEQIRDMAGLDVLTMPPKAARQFLELGLDPAALADTTGSDYRPGIDTGTDSGAVGIEALWDLDQKVVDCTDALEKEPVETFTADRLIDFFAEHGCGALLPRWSQEQIAVSAAEGKIPKLEHWKDTFAAGTIGIDSLMNLAGLNAFIADQKAMDARIEGLLP